MQTAIAISTLFLFILKLYEKKSMLTTVVPRSFHISNYFQLLACVRSVGLFFSRLDTCDIPDVSPGAYTGPEVSPCPCNGPESLLDTRNEPEGSQGPHNVQKVYQDRVMVQNVY